jgi:hypothetical protein
MQGELLLLLVVHLALTGLPGVAAALFAARCGVRQVPVLLAIALAATGVVAMLAFWSYYGAHELGQTFSYFALFGSVLLIAWALYGGKIERALLRQLATPLALWILGSAFLVFLGFVHGGADNVLAMSGDRFSEALPSDNFIPLFFSEWFFSHGHSAIPPVFSGGWLVSDRPPLQMGFVLLQRTFGWDDKAVNYQLTGVVLQQLWIVGLWALLLAARVGRVTRAMAMATLLVSDVAIVNGFFVWPKLLPAAMLLAAAALIVTPLWGEVRRSLWGAVLVVALLALAQLGHGASVFGVIPLAVVAALGGLPSWRWLGGALLVGIVLMAPWSAYQSFADPPGNRLTKWMLGGAVDIDHRGTTETIVDGYRDAGLGGTLHNKGQNFVAIVGGGPMAQDGEHALDAAESGDLSTAVTSIRSALFYFLLPSMGLLLIAPLAMVAGYRRRGLNPIEWGFALTCFVVLAMGAVAWALLMFGGSAAQAVIHQGSLFLPIIGLCGGVIGLRAVFPRFALWLLGFNVLLMLVLYAPALDPPPESSYSVAAAVIAAASLAAFGVVAFGATTSLRGERQSSSIQRPPSPASK